MKTPILFLVFALVAIACENSNNDIKPENKGLKPIILKLNARAPQGNSDFNISLASIDLNKNLANLTFVHSGGCDPNYRFNFYMKPRPNYICGGSDTVFVELKTNSGCERLDNTKVEFDFSEIIKCTDKLVFVGGAKNLEFDLKPGNESSQKIGLKTLSASELLPENQGDFNFNTAIYDWDKKLAIFNLAHSGGCDPGYSFKFYYRPKLTNDCIVDTVYVVLSTNNNCKRLDNTNVTFDLSSLTMCSKKIVFKGGTKLLELER
jgi:hypothetical protein